MAADREYYRLSNSIKHEEYEGRGGFESDPAGLIRALRNDPQTQVVGKDRWSDESIDTLLAEISRLKAELADSEERCKELESKLTAHEVATRNLRETLRTSSVDPVAGSDEALREALEHCADWAEEYADEASATYIAKVYPHRIEDAREWVGKARALLGTSPERSVGDDANGKEAK